MALKHIRTEGWWKLIFCYLMLSSLLGNTIFMV